MGDYAVLFKIHYWDGAVAARLIELTKAVRSGHIILFVDETSGPVDVPVDLPTIRCTVADAARIGLSATPTWAVFWYNTDYPLYLSAAALAPYDYVLMVEHDCIVRVDVDAMVQRARRDAVDLAAAPIKAAVEEWHWLPTLNGVYPPGTGRGCLTCICLLSRAAWHHLFARRLRLGLQFAAGHLHAARLPLKDAVQDGVVESWPFSEAFMATDLALNGFTVVDLALFGSTDYYDWWPPILPRKVAAAGFYHPVLDEDRYVASVLRHTPDLGEWCQPGSPLHARLSDCDECLVVRCLAEAFRAKGHVDQLGCLRAKWPPSHWVRLGLAFDACNGDHPTSHSRSTDAPQFWTIDLERVLDVYRICLAPHADPMRDEDIEVCVSKDGRDWRTIGTLPAGHGAGGQRALDVHLGPEALRLVSLRSSAGQPLRTGRLEVFALS